MQARGALSYTKKPETFFGWLITIQCQCFLHSCCHDAGFSGMLGVVNFLAAVDQQLIHTRLVLLVYENKDPEAHLTLWRPRNQFREYHQLDLSEPGSIMVLATLCQSIEGKPITSRAPVLSDVHKKEWKHNLLVAPGHWVWYKDIECVHSQAGSEVTGWWRCFLCKESIFESTNQFLFLLYSIPLLPVRLLRLPTEAGVVCWYMFVFPALGGQKQADGCKFQGQFCLHSEF